METTHESKNDSAWKNANRGYGNDFYTWFSKQGCQRTRASFATMLVVDQKLSQQSQYRFDHLGQQGMDDTSH